ncbi:MAG TPA: DUF4260 family protein [Actinomycetes bacterium]|jgi:hypothetical protein|nr:DUF4260 family protein [Actinomycetes bacterium]
MRHDLPSHGHPARTVTRRLAWLAIGLAAATLTVIQVTRHGAGALALAVTLAIAPDLTMLVGASRKLARGQLAPTAVPFYNAANRVWGPLVLLAAGAVWPGSAALLAGGLAWLAHVGLDRGLGFGLRNPAGFQRG